METEQRALRRKQYNEKSRKSFYIKYHNDEEFRKAHIARVRASQPKVYKKINYQSILFIYEPRTIQFSV